MRSGVRVPHPLLRKTELEFSSMTDICFMNIGVIALESRKNAGFCYGFSEVNRVEDLGSYNDLQEKTSYLEFFANSLELFNFGAIG